MLKAAKNVFKFDSTAECARVPLEPRKDAGHEIAVLACGDFTALREKFLKLEGVERVILGYSGGGKEIPTFSKIHDHAEALLIEFNSKTISFADILVAFRECVDPWQKEKRQHRVAIFWKTLAQQDEALDFVRKLQAEEPSKALHVEVERARRFFRARQTYPVLSLEPEVEGNEVAIVACKDLPGLMNTFLEIGGVERVVPGLTGGKQENPEDFKPLDHTGALFVEYAPATLSYQKILELWCECDKPWEEATSEHNRSALFWKTIPQQDAALQFIQELQAKNPSGKLFVDVDRVRKFYEIEIYPDADTIVSPKQKSPMRTGRPSLQQKLAAGHKPCLSEVSNPVWKTNRK